MPSTRCASASGAPAQRSSTTSGAQRSSANRGARSATTAGARPSAAPHKPSSPYHHSSRASDSGEVITYLTVKRPTSTSSQGPAPWSLRLASRQASWSKRRSSRRRFRAGHSRSRNWSTGPTGHRVGDAHDGRVLDLGPQQAREVCPGDLEGPVPHLLDLGGHRLGEPERVVHRGQLLVGHQQGVLATPPGLGPDDGPQDRREIGAAREPRERGAEPLAVRRVLPVHQEAQAHQVRHEPRTHQCRPELIARRSPPCPRG